MPLVGLGVLILWLGWFGFNGGSTFGTSAARSSPRSMLDTQLAAAAGVIGAALAVMYLKTQDVDIGMAGNGAIAGLVAITAPSGFVEYWAAPIIGAIAGVIVVYARAAIDKILDDPVGALSAHGLAGIWGTLAVGIFASPRLIAEGAGPGVWYDLGALWYSGSLRPARRPGAGGRRSPSWSCSSISYRDLLRDQEDDRPAGQPPRRRTPASTSPSTGCTGTRRQFIPQPEYSTGLPLGRPAAAPSARRRRRPSAR